MSESAAIVLVHGGLWQEEITSGRFWHEPGVVEGLERRGFRVVAPDRLARATSWTADADHLAELLPDGSVTVVAGSNGCSAAARLALAVPAQVEQLVLAWPATASDSEIDAQHRPPLERLGAAPEVVDALLDGDTMRGVGNAELAELQIPVGLVPADPENPFHQRRTVDELLGLLPKVEELAGCPEPPRPDFASHLDSFLDAVTNFVSS